MHVFTDTSPGGEPGREDQETLIRVAMERATEGAPPLPDLVPVALVQGRRRRVRARAAIGGATIAVAAIGVFATTLPVWGGDAAATRNVSAASSAGATAVPRAVRTPVHIEPSPGESSMADLPAAERAWQEEFQQRAAAVFDELLPDAFGTVHPVDLAVSRYQGGKDGPVFPLMFSVRPQAGPEATPADPPARRSRRSTSGAGRRRCRTASRSGPSPRRGTRRRERRSPAPPSPSSAAAAALSSRSGATTTPWCRRR